MNIQKVRPVFFSATGTTEKAVTTIADTIAEAFGVPCEAFDFTLPGARAGAFQAQAGELVVFGTPVYAGRVPNVLLKYLATLQGNGALAVPVVLYGNRNFDDGLIELRDLLEKGGFHTVAAGAFIGEHSFSTILAAGRPDADDLAVMQDFADKTAAKIKTMEDVGEPVAVDGTPDPYRGYYQPRDRKGNPVDIRKVKPLTNENCNDCKICADVCPMGSISHEDVREFTGICIKCGACIKKCPQHAKYYEDAGYLYHQHELEEGYARRAQPAVFL